MEEKSGDGGRMEGSETEDVKPTEDLMNDVNYYPVQEEHRPYIKVESLTKEYVAVLQTLQVILHCSWSGLDETLVSVSISRISRSIFLISVSSQSRKIMLQTSRSRLGLKNHFTEFLVSSRVSKNNS